MLCNCLTTHPMPAPNSCNRADRPATMLFFVYRLVVDIACEAFPDAPVISLTYRGGQVKWAVDAIVFVSSLKRKIPALHSSPEPLQ
jgi:hypothetical protein